MPLTALELFTRCRDHLIAQAAVSMGPDLVTGRPSLRYRGTHGRKCVIGVLIPDSVYDDAFEGCIVGRLPDAVLEAAGITKDLLPLAMALQKVHDKMPTTEWRSRLDEIGARFGVIPPQGGGETA